MSFAGATRTFLVDGNTHVIANPTHFDAYVALLPQNNQASEPYVDGFAPDAWVSVDQPILMISGVNDSTGTGGPYPQPGSGRIGPYNNMPIGAVENKYWLYFTGPASGHAEMNLKDRSASSAYTQSDFNDQATAAKETVSQFLDIHTRGLVGSVLDYNFISSSTLSQSGYYLDFDFQKK